MVDGHTARGAVLLTLSLPERGLGGVSCALTFCRPWVNVSICFCWRAMIATVVPAMVSNISTVAGL